MKPVPWNDQKPVFKPVTLNAIRDGLYRRAIQFTILSNPHFTGEEFERAFIMPEHAQKMRELIALGVQLKCEDSVNFALCDDAGNKVMVVRMIFNGTAPLPLPGYVMRGPLPDADPVLVARMRDWAAERYNIGCAFGDIYDAICVLNDACSNARTMALLIPCLPGLVADVSGGSDTPLGKAAVKMTSGPVGKFPHLPRDMQVRLKEASALVMAAGMTKDSYRSQPPRGSATLHYSGEAASGRRRFDYVHDTGPVYTNAMFL